ncbi:MAG: hypothetical protein K8L97_12530 [Anaerolineae bacterium]|nr:hypothetical protein [Anaerolineae bacterium]
MSNNQTPVIACNPKAIGAANRDAHAAVSKSIFSSDTIVEIKELTNGYGFRLPMETPMLYKVVEFVANERLCCPFFTFTLVVGEQFWLELSGGEGVKNIIESDILQIIQTGNFPTMEALETVYAIKTGTAGG